jgi:predicted enzyme related to lactoylglutathione lyase
MNNMNPVVHFEMPYEDKQRAADFYAKAFGWQPQMMGPEMGDYIVMTTTEMDEKTRFPKTPGQINGGFFKKSPNNQHPLVTISTHDIQETMKKVEAAGGKILGRLKPNEPDMIPGVGLYIAFEDTEGNRASILQPKGM